MKKLRWSDLSLVSKIVIEVGVLAALMFTINMLFYVRINNSMQEMDDVYTPAMPRSQNWGRFLRMYRTACISI